MSTTLLIRGGHVIDPANHTDRVTDILCVGDRIDSVADDISTAADTVIEADGLVVCPGLVDMAARLREPGQEHKATVASETRASAAGGITTLCMPPDTRPAIDAPAEVELLRQRAIQAARAWVFPLGGLTMSLRGETLSEMATLKRAGCVGVSNGNRPVTNTRILMRAMEYAATFDLTVHSEPMDPWLRDVGIAHEGQIASRLGLPGIPAEAETMEISRVLNLAEATGARVHFGRLSTAQGVELVANAQARGLPVTADVAIHQLFLSEHDLVGFDSRCHVIPPLRTTGDRDTLRDGVRSGVIAAICSDHQPHERDAKDAPLNETEPGISGLETLLPLTLRLVENGVLDLPTAIDRLSHAPARILGIRRGNLSPGTHADICLFDPTRPWTVDANALLSRGHNTPFDGWHLTGRVTHTVFEGRVIHSLT
ncbi:MAG: dihydroorotase [Gammaproteobacteria bacterium]